MASEGVVVEGKGWLVAVGEAGGVARRDKAANRSRVCFSVFGSAET